MRHSFSGVSSERNYPFPLIFVLRPQPRHCHDTRVMPPLGRRRHETILAASTRESLSWIDKASHGKLARQERTRPFCFAGCKCHVKGKSHVHRGPEGSRTSRLNSRDGKLTSGAACTWPAICGRAALRVSVVQKMTSSRMAVPMTSAPNAANGDMRIRASTVSGCPSGLGRNSPNTIALASLPGLPRTR